MMSKQTWKTLNLIQISDNFSGLNNGGRGQNQVTSPLVNQDTDFDYYEEVFWILYQFLNVNMFIYRMRMFEEEYPNPLNEEMLIKGLSFQIDR